MKPYIMTPKYYNEAAHQSYEHHDCSEGDSDICDHRFIVFCPRCQRQRTVMGEEMPETIGRGYICQPCEIAM